MQRIEIRGPSSFEQWIACYRSFRVAAISLDVVSALAVFADRSRCDLIKQSQGHGCMCAESLHVTGQVTRTRNLSCNAAVDFETSCRDRVLMVRSERSLASRRVRGANGSSIKNCSPSYPRTLCANCAGTTENTTRFGTISSCCATYRCVFPLLVELFRSRELHSMRRVGGRNPHLSRLFELLLVVCRTRHDTVILRMV